MTKREFISELKSQLSRYDEQEVASALQYYIEIIDDKMDNGLSEYAAVKSLGTPQSVALSIRSELVVKQVERTERHENKKGGIKNSRILLATMLASPVLLPLGIGLIAVLFALTVTLGSLLLAFSLSAGACLLSIAPALFIMISDGMGFLAILLTTGGLLVAAGVCGLLFSVLLKCAQVILFSINKAFSKKASKKLSEAN